MKMIWLFVLLCLVSCQKDKEVPAEVTRPEKVISLDEELGNFVFISNIKGLEIKGERIARQGNLTTGEDLSIINSSTKKEIDKFSMEDWGKVGFRLDQSILYVYPLKDSFEITYTTDGKNIVRKPRCEFKNLPDPAKFDYLIALTKEPNPDWESIITGISDLARMGDKKSYEFFINPDASSMTILKNKEDNAVSIIRVLKFMRKNGCKW